MRKRRLGAALALLGAVLQLSACADDGGALRHDSTVHNWETWALRSPADAPVPAPTAPRAASVERLVTGDEADGVPAPRPGIRHWLELAMELVARRPKDPPSASRAYAAVSVAMHDAVVAAAHWSRRYDDAAARGSYPDAHAALAAAASHVLAHTFPEHPRARLDGDARQVAQARVRAGRTSNAGADAGLRLGHAVARTVIDTIAGDERKQLEDWDGTRPRGAGRWAPPPGSVARPVQPLAGEWHTWVLQNGAELRPGPPPALHSAEFLAQAREIVRVRRELTPRQKRIAKFWEGGDGTALPPGIWNRVVLDYAERQRLTLPAKARVFALMNVAMADAGVAAWDAKYAYWNPRPVNGVRAVGLDRDWRPYLETPLFPAYVSGHAAYSAAAAEALAFLFPADAAVWRARAREAAISRLYGGIHWRADNEVGARLGRRIGRLVVERAERDAGEP